jgi:histidinol-phosphate aminotransferase
LKNLKSNDEKSMIEKMFRAQLVSQSLMRPDWGTSNSRSLDRLWLDKNENSDPGLAQILSGIIRDIPIDAVYSYPDLGELYRKIAEQTQVLPENLLITAGSDGAIRACFEACVTPGTPVLLTKPTFAMYEVYSQIYGADVTWLDYQASDHGPVLDLDTFVKTIKGTCPKLVCLPNPDSPTGTVFDPSAIELIVSNALEVGAMMLIDEAYYPFYDWTAVPLLDKYPNLVITRSFGKAWGAAGLRIGYAIGNPELIQTLHKQRPMYEIGSLSATIAEHLVPFYPEILESVHRLNQGKQYFLKNIEDLGLNSYKSYGNFFHVKFGKYASDIHDQLDSLAYYRKDFKEDCLKGYSRFSTASEETLSPIINCIQNVVNKS